MGLASAALSFAPLALGLWWAVARPRQQPAGA
jgi:hypothetical protein